MNGMYSHVIDALAKSPNLNHIVMADILLRQFILLYINRVGRRKGGLLLLLQLVSTTLMMHQANKTYYHQRFDQCYH